MSAICVNRFRFHFCTTIFIVGFLVLCGRLYFLQVIAAEEISAEAEATRKRVKVIESKRGDIVDKNGNLLAGTRSSIVIGIDPQVFQEEDLGRLAFLAGVLNEPWDVIKGKALTKYRVDSEGKERPLKWAKLGEVNEDIYASILKMRIKGVYGTRSYERFYPGRELAAHVLGFVNKERTAVMGVESAYDFYLNGQSGWLETEVDGRREELAIYRNRQVSARDGYHLQLTLDLYVQSTIEAALKEVVSKFNPQGASIIVSDPKTGEILGLANYPCFDPNQFWEFPIENQRNRAVTDIYEPGSTFKVVTISAGLEERILNPESLYDCDVAKKTYNGVVVPLPEDHGKNYGVISVRDIVKFSSNRGSALIGMQLGEKRMYDYSRAFGFGQRTGWPLGAEVRGILNEVKDWDGYTISRLPTGYAIGATPMQVHLAMATIANGGVYLGPRIVKRVFDNTGKTILEFERPDEGRRVVSEYTADTIAEMLEGVVLENGTAKRAALPGYEVAGKTGTSRKIIDGQYSIKNHFASFSGFFPASDPRVVITIMVDDAKIKNAPAYGGVVAAPVFKEVSEKLIPHMAIRKPEKLDSVIVAK